MHNTVKPGPIIADTITHWEQVMRYGQRRVFPANYNILQATDINHYLYYLVSGEILISRHNAVGDLMRLFILRKKSVLGMVSLFRQNKSETSWVTLTPCECYILTKEDIYTKTSREFLLNLLEQMAAMSSSMSKRFGGSNSSRLEVRVAQMLLHLAEACVCEKPLGKSIVFRPNITQRMTSELLGVHHVTLNRIINVFREQQIIGQFGKNRLEILDTEALRRYANDETPLTGY